MRIMYVKVKWQYKKTYKYQNIVDDMHLILKFQNSTTICHNYVNINGRNLVLLANAVKNCWSGSLLACKQGLLVICSNEEKGLAKV